MQFRPLLLKCLVPALASVVCFALSNQAGSARSSLSSSNHTVSSHKSHRKSSGQAAHHSHHGQGSSYQRGGRHHGRYHGRQSRRHGHVVVHHVRHAYPENFFLWHGPAFDESPYDSAIGSKVRFDFLAGTADDVPTSALVRAGIASYYPLRGGIFWRRESVKYIIMHSTESGNVMDAKRIIDSWSSGGRRHAGAHFVVDRDGHIYEAVDPDLAAVHVNIFKTLPGINNDNSIGIEMVHSGAQNYTQEQRAAVIRLVSYLQDHFGVGDDNVITHRYAQQGDHTDPVNFDWEGFLSTKAVFRKQALAEKLTALSKASKQWLTTTDIEPSATIYLQPNGRLPLPSKEKVVPQHAPLPAKSEENAEVSADIDQPTVRAIAPKALTPLRGPMQLEPTDARYLNHDQAPSAAPVLPAAP